MFFRYFDQEKYALNWITRGRLRFRPLSYYRQLEGIDVRGDANDGRLIHRPKGGVLITKADGTEVLLEGYQFEAAAMDNQIFVQCFSSVLSQELASKFGAHCVEVRSVERVVERIKSRARTASRLDYSMIYHREIEYRPLDVPPMADWALPERVTFIKPPEFSSEREYRIALGARGAFDPYNVDVFLSDGNVAKNCRCESPGGFEIEIGDLSDFAILHRL